MSMYENKNNLLRQRSDEVCETLCYTRKYAIKLMTVLLWGPTP